MDLWKQAGVLFSLELPGLGQASGPRAAIPQARNPGAAAEATLCSAQAQAAFPTAAEITLHLTSYPRSYQANQPGGKPGVMPKGRVLFKACPGDTGRQILYLAIATSNFSHLEGERSHKHQFQTGKLKGVKHSPPSPSHTGSASS